MTLAEFESKHKQEIVVGVIGITGVAILAKFKYILVPLIGLGILYYLYHKLYEANEHDKKYVMQLEKELILYKQRYPEPEPKYDLKEEEFIR